MVTNFSMIFPQKNKNNNQWPLLIKCQYELQGNEHNRYLAEETLPTGSYTVQ